MSIADESGNGAWSLHGGKSVFLSQEKQMRGLRHEGRLQNEHIWHLTGK